MQRFKSPRQVQQFLEPFALIGNDFRPRRHLLTAQDYRAVMAERFRAWRVATETAAAVLT
jgi:putative transposase